MSVMEINRGSYPAIFKSCKNLEQLIDWAEREGEKEDLYVVRIELNGKNLDEDEEKMLHSLGIAQVDELAIEFSTIEEIIGKAMLNTIQQIQEIQSLNIQFAREFRASEKVDDEKVKYVLVQCRSIIEGLEEIFKTHVSGKLLLRHQSLWVAAEKELTNILQCILQARGLTEPKFIADLMEYDLVHALTSWDELLEKEILDSPALSNIFSLNTGSPSSDNGVDV